MGFLFSIEKIGSSPLAFNKIYFPVCLVERKSEWRGNDELRTQILLLAYWSGKKEEQLLWRKGKLQIYQIANNTKDDFLMTDSKANLPMFSGNIMFSFYETDASREYHKHFQLFLRWL